MWLVDSSYKLVNEVQLKLSAWTTLEDTHSLNNDVEQVFYLKQNIPTDTKTDIDIHPSNERIPIALDQLTTLTLSAPIP